MIWLFLCQLMPFRQNNARLCKTLVLGVMVFFYGQTWASHLQKTPERTLKLYDAATAEQIWHYGQYFNDVSDSHTITRILQQPNIFQKPEQPYAAFGMRKNPIWLKIPITPTDDSAWIVDINYPTLNKVDYYLVKDKQIIAQQKLGTHRDYYDSFLSNRSYAMYLNMQANKNYTLYVRVESENVLILPLSIKKPKDFLYQLEKEEFLQGCFFGSFLFLILYCVSKFLSLRKIFYVKYAIFIFGYLLLFLYHFGTGQQFFWTNHLWIDKHIAGIATLIVNMGAFLFLGHSLRSDGSKHRLIMALSRFMQYGAYFVMVLLVLYVFGIFTEHQRQHVVFVWLFILPWMCVLPVSLYQMYQKNALGVYVLLAVLVHFMATFTMVQVMYGFAPANFWQLHSLQIGASLDILLFMLMVSYITKKDIRQAKKITHEHQALKKEVVLDPLTGLANRRGLTNKLNSMSSSLAKKEYLVTYFIDLDNFKYINDEHGHHIGDDVLVAIANRLKDNVRSGDFVSRLGGDEFVVLMQNIYSLYEAQTQGEHVLSLFQKPIFVEDFEFFVTQSIGYALYPLDTEDIEELILLADEAMYKVKKMGKNKVYYLGQ